MLPSAMPLREAPFILCKMENVFWSVPRVWTEKFALKFMVNLGKCHGSVGRKSPKSKPKHTAKCLCVCLTNIWVIALTPWELVLNRRRSGTISLTKKCPKWWLHSQSWLDKNCLSQGQHYNQKKEEKFTWYHNLDALGFNHVLWQRGHIIFWHCRHEPTPLLKNARWRIQAIGSWTFEEGIKEAAEWRDPLLPVSTTPPAASSTSSCAGTKLCANVVWTGLREPEQVETCLANTAATARERLWLSVTVLC